MQEIINKDTTFLWFDYETFGNDAVKDRPVQFGALRTDPNFRRIGKPILRYVLPADDYLPSATASMITGITPMSVMEQEDAKVEFEFAKDIFEEMVRPNTISIGYNCIKFDDVVTRFLFWRNLLPPYQRESREGRGKFDLFVLIYSLYAFFPEALVWPKKPDGRVSMRLEELSKANHIQHSHAHDACSDAEATMMLAELIAKKQPKIWNYALNLSLPTNAEEILAERKPLLYVDPYCREEKRGLRIVLPLMEDPSIAKQWVCWDLNADPNELWGLSADDLRERLFVSSERREQGVKPLPLILINAKKQPFFAKGIGWIDGRGAGLFDEKAAFYRARAEELLSQTDRIKSLQGLFAELAESSRAKKEKTYVLPEEDLYFHNYSWSDKEKMEEFRKTPVQDMQEKFASLDIEDKGIEELILHFMARNWPEETLDPSTEAQWRKFKAAKLMKGLGGARTFEDFFSEIDALCEKYAEDEDKLAKLEEVREYGEFLLGEFGG